MFELRQSLGDMKRLLKTGRIIYSSHADGWRAMFPARKRRRCLECRERWRLKGSLLCKACRPVLSSFQVKHDVHKSLDRRFGKTSKSKYMPDLRKKVA